MEVEIPRVPDLDEVADPELMEILNEDNEEEKEDVNPEVVVIH